MKRTGRNGSGDSSTARAIRFVATAVAIAALYFARDVLIPAALAILLAFLLNPLVRRMTRIGIPRVAGVSISVLAVCAVTVGLGMMLAHEFVDLTRSLPEYRENLKSRMESIRSSTGSFTSLKNTITDLRKDIAASQPATSPSTHPVQAAAAAAAATAVKSTSPVPVEVVNSGPTIFDIATSIALPVLAPIADAGIVLLLLIFLLLSSDDVRDRLVWLAGTQRISINTATLDEAGQRISGYLRMQLLINLCYGVVIGSSLWIIGVPSALFWGVMAAALRFVPFVGPWIAGILPVLISIAIFKGWGRPLGVITTYVGAESIASMVMEPWLYSRGSGISRIGIIFSAIFWAWLWGPVGLILAVPMTVCLMVLGKQAPQLAMINNLFGEEMEAPRPARFYQRLLVGDETNAQRLFAEELRHATFVQACTQLLMPVLVMLQRDLDRERIGAGQAKRAIGILDEIAKPEKEAEKSLQTYLFCIAVGNEVDDLAATLLSRAASSEGIGSESISSAALASEVALRARELNVKSICLIKVPPSSPARRRHLAKILGVRLKTVALFAMDIIAADDDSHPASRRRRPPIQKIFNDLPTFIEAAREANFVPSNEK